MSQPAILYWHRPKGRKDRCGDRTLIFLPGFVRSTDCDIAPRAILYPCGCSFCIYKTYQKRPFSEAVIVFFLFCFANQSKSNLPVCKFSFKISEHFNRQLQQSSLPFRFHYCDFLTWMKSAVIF